MSSVDLKQLSYPSFHIISVLTAQVHDNLNSCTQKVNYKVYSLVSIMASNSSTTIMTKERKERLTLDHTNMTKKKIKYSKDSSSGCGSSDGGGGSSSRRNREEK